MLVTFADESIHTTVPTKLQSLPKDSPLFKGTSNTFILVFVKTVNVKPC